MGQVIAVDTSLFIYLFEKHPEFAKPSEVVLRQIEKGKATGIFSVIGMVELQTGPKRQDRYDLANRYRELVTTFPNLKVVGFDDRIVELTSDLRARYNLATPDAIHLATAIEMRATCFVTNDKALRKVKEIEVRAL